MKKLITVKICLLLLGVALFNISCSKDDDNEEPAVVAPSIVGSWEFSKKGYMGTDNVPYSVADYPHGCATKKDNFLFTKVGNFTTTIYADCDRFEVLGYNYTFADNVLNYSTDGAVVINPYVVIAVSETVLKVKLNYSRLKRLSATSKSDPTYVYYELVKK